MSEDQPTHIDAAIADLEGWLERISTAIGTLKYFRAQGGSLPNMQPQAGARGSSNGEISHDTFFQMTIPDAAEKDLKLAKKTKPTAGIAASLLKGGLKSASKDFSGMVKTILSRDSRFVKVNKEWGLTEWYPGMRRGQRTTTPEGTTEAKPEEPTKKEPKKKEARDETKKRSPDPNSLNSRMLWLLDSNPSETFTAKKVAETLGGQRPSVKAALTTMYKKSLIARPRTGEYQSLRSA